jgi:acyl-CoA synthetase (NDP forming)/GNAT superfamily N-acetyltransferase
MSVTEILAVDAVRSDGGLVRIGPLGVSDRLQLQALHANVSDRGIYLRFFTASRGAADAYLDTLLSHGSRTHEALVGRIGGEIVGLAAFEAVDAVTAEVALLIADAHQNEGIGTLLLEHLASVARHRGFTRFVADVLAENSRMLRVFRDLGFEVTRSSERELVRIELDLEPSPLVLAARDAREQAADAASLQPLLAPGSIAVIGAGSRTRSVGHQILRNLLEGGFTGTVQVVNPRHEEVLGVRAVPSATELVTTPELAIVAVPAGQLLRVLRDCGTRGVRGVLILTAGFGETGQAGRDLQNAAVVLARSYGIRMIGPNCLGVLNTDPAVQMNATFAPLPMNPGGLALASQSGALGVAVVTAAARAGLGLSQFVSMGNKADVSGNDLLLAWEHDARTSVIGLYLESFGNARNFARIARRVSRSKPIVAIKAGRSSAGQRAGQSHTAAAASSDAVVDALFTAAGVLRVDTMTEMLDVARVLSTQPLLGGPRLAILGNSGGPEILATDAATAAGLTVARFGELTLASLRAAAPTAASVQNPVDLGASAQPEEIMTAMEILLAADEVDSVLAVFTETLVSDIEEVMSTIASASATTHKPVVATHVGGEPRLLPTAGTDSRVPVFDFPEPAAVALGRSWKYTQIRSRKPIEAPDDDGMDADGARALVRRLDADHSGWLDAADAARLLGLYGIPLCEQRVVATREAAVTAARGLGYPVAVKLPGGTVHKSDIGGVRLDVKDDAELRAAFDAVWAAAPAATGVLIQPMVESGLEMILGVVQDPQFGPVVMIGAGGVLADVIADNAFRLAPLTEDDAAEAIDGLRTARLFDGYRGSAAISRPALRNLWVRLSWLAHDVAEVAEIDLNPVVCRGDRLVVVDAKVRLAPVRPTLDPVLRQLPAPPAIRWTVDQETDLAATT